MFLLSLFYATHTRISLGTRRCCGVDSTSQQRRVPSGMYGTNSDMLLYDVCTLSECHAHAGKNSSLLDVGSMYVQRGVVHCLRTAGHNCTQEAPR